MRHSPEFHRQLRTSQRRRARRPLDFRIALAAVVAIGGVLGATWSRGWPDIVPAPPAVSGGDRVADASMTRKFGFCHSGGGTNCVVDGDTFWIDGERIRIADIDTPETHPPRCPEEARLGEAATQRLQALLNQGPVTLEIADRDTDRHGRKLRIVMRGGRSLGDQLVAEGLARPWTGRRQPWC